MSSEVWGRIDKFSFLGGSFTQIQKFGAKVECYNDNGQVNNNCIFKLTQKIINSLIINRLFVAIKASDDSFVENQPFIVGESSLLIRRRGFSK